MVDGEKAVIHRVLKPGGQLGLIWNVRDESIGWVAALTRIIFSEVSIWNKFRNCRKR